MASSILRYTAYVKVSQEVLKAYPETKVVLASAQILRPQQRIDLSPLHTIRPDQIHLFDCLNLKPPITLGMVDGKPTFTDRTSIISSIWTGQHPSLLLIAAKQLGPEGSAEEALDHLLNELHRVHGVGNYIGTVDGANPVFRTGIDFSL